MTSNNLKNVVALNSEANDLVGSIPSTDLGLYSDREIASFTAKIERLESIAIALGRDALLDYALTLGSDYRQQGEIVRGLWTAEKCGEFWTVTDSDGEEYAVSDESAATAEQAITYAWERIAENDPRF